MRTLLIVLLLLVIIIGLIAIIVPKKASLEHSIFIQASPENVYPHLVFFEKRNAWYPWYKLDPDIETTTEGTDGEVGSISSWKGNNKVGEGYQKLILSQPYERVEHELEFIKPFKSEAKAYHTLTREADGTRVTWGFESPMPVPSNIFAFFMQLEKNLAKNYDKGLAELKKIVEKK